MCDQTEVNYLPKDIVWVKLNRLWWPGEVQDQEKLEEDVTSGLKKKPIAVVKFFDEDSYEFPKNLNQICKYNCLKKNEFIHKGIELARPKGNRDVPSKMTKFSKDVIKAEELTGGNPNILYDPKFLPEEKLDYREHFGLKPLKKTPTSLKTLKHSKSPFQPPIKSSPFNKNKNLIPLPTLKRPLTNGVTKPYKDRTSINSTSSFITMIRIQEDLTISESNNANSITCYLCSFSCKRIDVIIEHCKSHYRGDLLPAPPHVPARYQIEYYKNIVKTKESASFSTSKVLQEKTSPKRALVDDSTLMEKGESVKRQKRKVKEKKDDQSGPAEALYILKNWGEGKVSLTEDSIENDNNRDGRDSSVMGKECIPPPKEKSCFDFDEGTEEFVMETSQLRLGQKLPRVIFDEKRSNNTFPPKEVDTEKEKLDMDVDKFLDETKVPEMPDIPDVSGREDKVLEYNDRKPTYKEYFSFSSHELDISKKQNDQTLNGQNSSEVKKDISSDENSQMIADDQIISEKQKDIAVNDQVVADVEVVSKKTDSESGNFEPISVDLKNPEKSLRTDLQKRNINLENPAHHDNITEFNQDFMDTESERPFDAKLEQDSDHESIDVVLDRVSSDFRVKFDFEISNHTKKDNTSVKLNDDQVENEIDSAKALKKENLDVEIMKSKASTIEVKNKDDKLAEKVLKMGTFCEPEMEKIDADTVGSTNENLQLNTKSATRGGFRSYDKLRIRDLNRSEQEHYTKWKQNLKNSEDENLSVVDGKLEQNLISSINFQNEKIVEETGELKNINSPVQTWNIKWNENEVCSNDFQKGKRSADSFSKLLVDERDTSDPSKSEPVQVHTLSIGEESSVLEAEDTFRDQESVKKCLLEENINSFLTSNERLILSECGSHEEARTTDKNGLVMTQRTKELCVENNVILHVHSSNTDICVPDDRAEQVSVKDNVNTNYVKSDVSMDKEKVEISIKEGKEWSKERIEDILPLKKFEISEGDDEQISEPMEAMGEVESSNVQEVLSMEVEGIQKTTPSLSVEIGKEEVEEIHKKHVKVKYETCIMTSRLLKNIEDAFTSPEVDKESIQTGVTNDVENTFSIDIQIPLKEETGIDQPMKGYVSMPHPKEKQLRMITVEEGSYSDTSIDEISMRKCKPLRMEVIKEENIPRDEVPEASKKRRFQRKRVDYIILHQKKEESVETTPEKLDEAIETVNASDKDAIASIQNKNLDISSMPIFYGGEDHVVDNILEVKEFRDHFRPPEGVHVVDVRPLNQFDPDDLSPDEVIFTSPSKQEFEELDRRKSAAAATKYARPQVNPQAIAITQPKLILLKDLVSTSTAKFGGKVQVLVKPSKLFVVSSQQSNTKLISQQLAPTSGTSLTSGKTFSTESKLSPGRKLALETRLIASRPPFIKHFQKVSAGSSKMIVSRGEQGSNLVQRATQPVSIINPIPVRAPLSIQTMKIIRPESHKDLLPEIGPFSSLVPLKALQVLPTSATFLPPEPKPKTLQNSKEGSRIVFKKHPQLTVLQKAPKMIYRSKAGVKPSTAAGTDQSTIVLRNVNSQNNEHVEIFSTVHESGKYHPLSNAISENLNVLIESSSTQKVGNIIIVPFNPANSSYVNTASSQPNVVKTSQDILAKALADAQVFETEYDGNEMDSLGVVEQHNTMQPSLSHGVLETSLTLNQPILTPLEVPSVGQLTTLIRNPVSFSTTSSQVSFQIINDSNIRK